ncbi:MAG TPA: DinB family protein [Chryseosolibacter sp.]|nr:DinB family protein [Chryseosolibacter sp.]
MEREVIDSLSRLFDRDLKKLEDEIRQYPGETALWKIAKDIKNPAGNLALHLCGNLQHYIGKVLGGRDYVRNRDLEFSAKDIPQSELIAQVAKTRQTVLSVLGSLDANLLGQQYPEKVFDYPMTTAYFLIHLAGHLNYHLGQINYHRRLVH